MLFDLSLSAGYSSPPDLDDLIEQIPALKDPALRARLQASRPGGFLGLDLPEMSARALLGRLKQAKARGQIVPSAYREPKVTIEAALRIAERAIGEDREIHFPTYTFEPVHYWREGPRWWIFLAGSEQLQQEGIIPGALFAYIDKLDGHVWQPEEMERLFEEQ